MKIAAAINKVARFSLWRAILCAAVLHVPRARAQEASGGKPEMPAPAPAMAAHSQAAKVPSTSLTLTLTSQTPARLPAAGGTLAFLDKTLTLQLADLAAMPHETVTVINGHTKASETYSGVPVANLISRLGLPFEKVSEPKLLKTYVIAEGTDGYKVIVSAYETLSAIRQTDVIVADAVVGPEGARPLAADGAFKLIIPGDSRPQRWVQNLRSLTFKTID